METSKDPYIAEMAHNLRSAVGNDPRVDKAEELANHLAETKSVADALITQSAITGEGAALMGTVKLMLDHRRQRILSTVSQ